MLDTAGTCSQLVFRPNLAEEVPDSSPHSAHREQKKQEHNRKAKNASRQLNSGPATSSEPDNLAQATRINGTELSKPQTRQGACPQHRKSCTAINSHHAHRTISCILKSMMAKSTDRLISLHKRPLRIWEALAVLKSHCYSTAEGDNPT